MFSILHISDLHRSRNEPVANEDLIASLLADRERYLLEEPRVPSPGAIVVSGDLIHGAAVGEQSWQSSIRAQYRVAEEFLSELCHRFLDGDRSRMILTPGNHDVCWNESYRAMKRVASRDSPRDVRAALLEPDSRYRWDWSQKRLFKISDATAYDQRMNAYWEFAERFYNGTQLVLPLDRTRGFQFFELLDRRIIAASFASVAGNDCYRDTGAIAPGAIGSCAIALQDLQRAYELTAGVWHHSVHGPPGRSDYMDVAYVKEMAGHGFQLGLHGHQHVASTMTQLIHLDETQAMAVVSAGSLCAGGPDLPRGVNRQYNLLVFDDQLDKARVHVREMGDGLQFTPQAKRIVSGWWF